MTYVLYNPLADNRSGKANSQTIKDILTADSLTFLDITELDLKDFFANKAGNNRVVIAGGDGTVLNLANTFNGELPDRPIFYFPIGTGNDLMRDLRKTAFKDIVQLNPYIKNLPKVTVNSVTKYFLNGVGFGIDGYCCEEGDKLREKSQDEINYASIAVKGMLFHFKPRNAVITVDGVEHTYKNVWIAPTMNGRFYGGGMEVAPDQDRLNPEGKVSTVIMHCPNKLKTLMVFPSIFKGTHVNHTKMVEVLTGNDVTVTFDRPTPLQIDGETFKDIESYHVYADPARGRENAKTAVAIGEM